MTFIPKNPLIMPEVSDSPSVPDNGNRGLYASDDGWYGIDSNGKTQKLNTDVIPATQTIINV